MLLAEYSNIGIYFAPELGTCQVLKAPGARGSSEPTCWPAAPSVEQASGGSDEQGRLLDHGVVSVKLVAYYPG
jgi:hypothetical protein